MGSETKGKRQNRPKVKFMTGDSANENSAHSGAEFKHSTGWAWIILTAALLVHVIDEAVNDFLQVYNPVASSLRSDYPFLPLPVFTYTEWLTGLLVAVTVLFMLSIFAFKRFAWIRILSYFYAIIMLLNGIIHLAGSIYQHTWLPGVYSSPLLLLAAARLLTVTIRRPELNRSSSVYDKT